MFKYDFKFDSIIVDVTYAKDQSNVQQAKLYCKYHKPMLTPSGRLRADFIILTLSPSSLRLSQSLLCCSSSAMFIRLPSTLWTKTGTTINKIRNEENNRYF